MRLVFAGTPAVAADTLRYLLDHSSHEVVAVISRPDAPQGRSGRPLPSPVARLALDRGLELLRPVKPSEPAFVDRLRDLAPDCCPVVAYGALIPAEVLAIPRHGWVNVHYSVLPRWRGAAPVQRAIMSGDQESGVTVFRLVPALDAGAVFASVAYRFTGTETAGEALQALQFLGAGLLLDTLDAIEAGTAIAVDQPAVGVTHAAKLTVAEARIDWDRAAADLARLVRGCNPSPMAWTTLAGQRFRILRAAPAGNDVADLAAGEIRPGRRSVVVGTGHGGLELIEVQPQGRGPMRAADWGRGLRGVGRFEW